MNGPEHYAEAERLLNLAREDLTNPVAPAWTEMARVHSNLAIAAAQVETAYAAARTSGGIRADWIEAVA